jgi:hypothetical protein
MGQLPVIVGSGIVVRAMDVNSKGRSLLKVAAGLLLVLVGVVVIASGIRSDPEPEDASVSGSAPASGGPASVDPVDPGSVFDPVRAGEATPPTYRQLLGRDQIAPIYNPSFTTADDVDWPLEVLIVGVTGTNTSKAYPVSHLNRREMVIDDIDGDPILVSW